MNTPTPRTDAAWTSSFEGKQMSAGQTARALRECSQKLETELAALRADLAALEQCHDDNCRALVKIAEELATERERLDWLLSYDGVDWILSAHKNRKLFEGESDNRALLEAAMKDGAK